MAKLTFLATSNQMMELAHTVRSAMRLENVEIKLITVSNALDEAAASVGSGTDIFITRGAYAPLIEKALNRPVVGMRITVQELCVLIHTAKERLQKQRPVIGLCGLPNLFGNTDRLDEIFDVTIRKYLVEQDSELPEAVDRAVAENADIIIGGLLSCRRADELSFPYLPLASSEESVREALQTALQMAYVSDLEKKNAAEWAVLLDYSFNGIIRLDAAGAIIALNLPAQNILKKEPSQVIGLGITSLIREVTDDILKDVLINGNERFSIFFTLNNIKVIANFAPILVEGEIHGAVLSCHEVQKIVQISESLRAEQYQSGHVAVYSFKQFYPPSPKMNALITSARLHANTDVSVLLTGEPSTEKDIIAQAMHNDSPRQNHPFVTIYCRKSDLRPQDLFFAPDNSRGIPELGRLTGGGTLYLRDIECLSAESQEWLWEFLQGSLQRAPDGIKIIASTSVDLWQKVLTGEFLENLYYRIAVVSLKLPSLRTRKNDILYWIDYYLGLHSSAHSRYITLTHAARSLLEHYGWTGNLAQLDNFCQSLVVNAHTRTVSEETAARLLDQLYPKAQQTYLAEGGTSDHPAEALTALLEKYGGNRSLVMRELNISRSTLWRRMKKYNIHTRYQ